MANPLLSLEFIMIKFYLSRNYAIGLDKNILK